jgi:hypothetical protein
VGAGHRDAVVKAHQFRQHLGPGHHRDARGAGRPHFRVGLVHGAGDDDRIGPLHVFAAVPDMHLYTQFFQPLGDGAVLQVGTGHLVTQVQHHFGDAAHARAAHTDEMQVPYPPHALSAVTGPFLCGGRRSHDVATSKQASATIRSASVKAMLRAASAIFSSRGRSDSRGCSRSRRRSAVSSD